jgi:chromosome segregation ATPase
MAKKELRDLQRKKSRLEERFAPALAGVNAKEAYKDQIQVVLDTRKRTLKSAEDEAEAMVGKSDTTISRVQAIRIELEGNENFLTAKRKEVADLKRKITHLKGLYNEKPKEFNAAEWNRQIVSTHTLRMPAQQILTIF